MRHLEIGQLFDCVRGIGSGEHQGKMERHLASGCRSCSRTVSVLRQFAELAEAESNYEAPHYAVRSARAIFALQRPEKVYFLPRVIGRLIYDSFREPVPAGVRARHRVTRHALYEASNYSLDLRLEHQVGTARVSLIGQIANEKEPSKPMANLPVFLFSERKVIARALSNAFGEFQFEYEPGRHLRLYVQASHSLKKNIQVSLTRLTVKD